MTARECAIQGAAMAEQNAQEFCKKLAELTKDGPLHRLYNELTTWKTAAWPISKTCWLHRPFATTSE
jgi:hypothetical protein